MNSQKLVEMILRIGVFGTFLGHGLVALQVNPGWIRYLESIGFTSNHAQTLLPIIGSIDLIVAFVILIRPIQAVLIYAFIWAFLTALIRPISGESILGFVERASNWATALALYVYLYLPNKKS